MKKKMNRDIVCIFEIIFRNTIQLKQCYRTKILFIIYMELLGHPELWQFTFFQEIFRKNSQTILVLVNTRNIYVKYSHCGPIHIKCFNQIIKHIYNWYNEDYSKQRSLLYGYYFFWFPGFQFVLCCCFFFKWTHDLY